MNQEPVPSLPSLVRTRILRLNAMILGIATGLISGVGLMLATIALVIKGGSVVGPHLALINQVYVGYRVSWAGSLVGFAYGGVTGFVAAYCGATIYNRISGRREKAACRR